MIGVSEPPRTNVTVYLMWPCAVYVCKSWASRREHAIHVKIAMLFTSHNLSLLWLSRKKTNKDANKSDSWKNFTFRISLWQAKAGVRGVGVCMRTVAESNANVWKWFPSLLQAAPMNELTLQLHWHQNSSKQNSEFVFLNTFRKIQHHLINVLWS